MTGAAMAAKTMCVDVPDEVIAAAFAPTVVAADVTAVEP